MHDARVLLDPAIDARVQLKRRGYDFVPGHLDHLLTTRNQAIQKLDQSRRESKSLANDVQQAARKGEPTNDLTTRARALKDTIRDFETAERQASQALHDYLMGIPNLPDPTIPDGDSEEFASLVKTVGQPASFNFTPRDHVDIAESLGIYDPIRASKLSGPRFTVLKGPGAALERAIATFFLDLHTKEHGYTEYSLPSLVTRDTMTGTGQLPKFEQDLFKTAVGERELFLIPTAEVPLVNLFANEILDADTLPIAATAHTPSFRSEAGSYGRDTRGMIRLHEFSKVELVRLCAPNEAESHLEQILSNAEACLRRLELPYRVVDLPAGDIAFAAQKTLDIEVWIPSQNTYREISSASNCGTFQARRAKIRYRNKNRGRDFPATLNASGLPIGRTVVALLENGQQQDGSVRLPDALKPYLGWQTILPNGTTQ